MNRVMGVVVGAVGILLVAGLLLVGGPFVQLYRLPAEMDLKPYTHAQARGRATYVDLGCAYCHSQQPRDRAFAPDTERGWGRASTPGDYVYDYPHQLGTMRTGPDLLNIGARQPSQQWHLAHLYNPRAVVDWSIMPGYPFLFEVKAKPNKDDVVVQLPPAYAPETGVVVARPEALELVDYLVALDRTYPSIYLQTQEASKDG